MHGIEAAIVGFLEVKFKCKKSELVLLSPPLSYPQERSYSLWWALWYFLARKILTVHRHAIYPSLTTDRTLGSVTQGLMTTKASFPLLKRI